MNRLDLLNAEGLDDSILSNADGVVSSAVKVTSTTPSLLKYDNDGFSIIPIIDKNYFYKKWADGTIQQGFPIINGKVNELGLKFNKAFVGIKEWAYEDTIRGKGEANLKNVDYPKDKGFVKSDGKGNYFYFAELPELIRGEILRLESELKQKKAMEDAAKAEATAAAAKRAAEEAKRAELQQQTKRAELEAQAKKAELEKAELEKKTELEKAKLEAETTAKKVEIEAEEAAKKKRNIMIIGGVGAVVLLVGGFFVWKKFIKK